MAILAVVLLWVWGALSGGFGAYALRAAFESESLFHAVQAGISLLIATVSISTGLVIIVVAGLKKSIAAYGVPPVTVVSTEAKVSPSEQGEGLHGQPE